jgi:hypothetical protein
MSIEPGQNKSTGQLLKSAMFHPARNIALLKELKTSLATFL